MKVGVQDEWSPTFAPSLLIGESVTKNRYREVAPRGGLRPFLATETLAPPDPFPVMWKGQGRRALDPPSKRGQEPLIGFRAVSGDFPGSATGSEGRFEAQAACG